MPRPGTATVAWTYDTGGFAPDGEPIVAMTVAVMVEGLTPYSATLQDRLPGSIRPRVTTGSVLPVIVDDEDPNLVRIDWRQMDEGGPPPQPAAPPQEPAAPPQEPAAPPPQATPPPQTPPPQAPPPPQPAPGLLSTMPTVPPVGGPPVGAAPMMPAVPPVAPTPPAGSAAAGEGDPLDRIDKLNALRQSGALSEAEFEVAKAKILGEL